MTAWEGDYLIRDIMFEFENYYRLKKIVCKFFREHWKMQKVFQNVFKTVSLSRYKLKIREQ